MKTTWQFFIAQCVHLISAWNAQNEPMPREPYISINAFPYQVSQFSEHGVI